MYIRYIWMLKYSYPGGVTNSDTTPDIFSVAQPRVFLFRRCLRKFLSTNGTRKLTYMDAHTTWTIEQRRVHGILAFWCVILSTDFLLYFFRACCWKDLWSWIGELALRTPFLSVPEKRVNVLANIETTLWPAARRLEYACRSRRSGIFSVLTQRYDHIRRSTSCATVSAAS